MRCSREAVWQALDELVRALAERQPEVVEIIVSGSFVTGTRVPGSDVDLLIVLSHADRPFSARVPTFLPSSFPVGVDVFPYTRAEVERMREEGNAFVVAALRGGLTLFRRRRRAAS